MDSEKKRELIGRLEALADFANGGDGVTIGDATQTCSDAIAVIRNASPDTQGDPVSAPETGSVSRMVHLESAGKFMVQIDCLVEALQEIRDAKPIVTRNFSTVERYPEDEVDATVTESEYDYLQEIAGAALAKAGVK